MLVRANVIAKGAIIRCAFQDAFGHRILPTNLGIEQDVVYQPELHKGERSKVVVDPYDNTERLPERVNWVF